MRYEIYLSRHGYNLIKVYIGDEYITRKVVQEKDRILIRDVRLSTENGLTLLKKIDNYMNGLELINLAKELSPELYI